MLTQLLKYKQTSLTFCQEIRVSHRWGFVEGVQFSDTTLQGADQGSRSQPNNHTLNSRRQNGSR